MTFYYFIRNIFVYKTFLDVTDKIKKIHVNKKLTLFFSFLNEK